MVRGVGAEVLGDLGDGVGATALGERQGQQELVGGVGIDGAGVSARYVASSATASSATASAGLPREPRPTNVAWTCACSAISASAAPGPGPVHSTGSIAISTFSPKPRVASECSARRRIRSAISRPRRFATPAMPVTRSQRARGR